MDNSMIIEVIMASLHRQGEPGVKQAFAEFSKILKKVASDDQMAEALKELEKNPDSGDGVEMLFAAIEKGHLKDNKVLNAAARKMMDILENRDLQFSGTGTVQKRTYISYEEDDDEW